MAWSFLATVVTLGAIAAVWRFYPPDNPRQAFVKAQAAVELRTNHLAWIKVMLRSTTAMGEVVTEGYSRFSKRGRLFVLSSLGLGPIVILPSPQLYLLNKPENQLAAFEIQLETWQPSYTVGKKGLYESTINSAFNIVRKELTKDVGRFAETMAQELAAGIDHSWGSLKEWKTVNVYDTCSQIIARTMCRLYFGMPLCHDNTLLEQSRQYSTAVFGSAALISTLPRALRRLSGPVIAFPAKRRLAMCKKILVPYVETRLAQTRKGEAVPNDVLQWMIEEAHRTNPDQMQAVHLTQSLLILMLSSIHGTSYAFTNCILDLYSSDCCDDFVAGIREECERVAAESGGLGNIDALAKLHHVDSCIKESLRISGFTVVSSMRVISATNGVEMDDSTVIPKGVRVAVPLQAIHHDPSIYHDPLRFNAFRFSRAYESSQTAGSRQDAAETRKQSLCVHVNERFLTFGFGKHTCPGRFLASQMLSLAMAYIVQNYDVEHITRRTESQPILNILMPPVSATISVRRRA